MPGWIARPQTSIVPIEISTAYQHNHTLGYAPVIGIVVWRRVRRIIFRKSLSEMYSSGFWRQVGHAGCVCVAAVSASTYAGGCDGSARGGRVWDADGDDEDVLWWCPWWCCRSTGWMCCAIGGSVGTMGGLSGGGTAWLLILTLGAVDATVYCIARDGEKRRVDHVVGRADKVVAVMRWGQIVVTAWCIS